jgi:hypothetical protein
MAATIIMSPTVSYLSDCGEERALSNRSIPISVLLGASCYAYSHCTKLQLTNLHCTLPRLWKYNNNNNRVRDRKKYQTTPADYRNVQTRVLIRNSMQKFPS